MMVPDSWTFGAEPATTTAPASGGTVSTIVDILSKAGTAAAQAGTAYAQLKASKVKPPAPVVYQTIAPTSTGMSTTTMILIGGGALAALGLLYFATRK